MELKDVKLPKKSEKGSEPMSMDMDSPAYPYGLQLRFDEKQFDQIPLLKNYKVGDRLMVQAEAVVTSVSMSARQGGKEDKELSVQIEKIACEPKMKKAPEKMSMKEYRAMREE